MTTYALASSGGLNPESKEDRTARSTKNRVQFDLPPRSMDRLNALKVKTEATSYAEVIKNALRLYEALIEDIEKGREILVRDEHGAISPYKLFL